MSDRIPGYLTLWAARTAVCAMITPSHDSSRTPRPRLAAIRRPPKPIADEHFRWQKAVELWRYDWRPPR
jgi:hypothetical protein